MMDKWNSVSQQVLLNRRAALKLGGGMLLSLRLLPATTAETAQRRDSLPYEEYAKYDALDLAKLVRQRQVKPEELLEAAIARANAVEPRINWTSEGLPVGVHFMGRFGDEATLFRLASQLEQSWPWVTRRPDLKP